MKKSKTYIEKSKLIKSESVYSPKEAVNLLKKVSYAKFTESIEVHFNLGIDPRHADQQLRGTFSLPNGTGKTKKVLALVEGEEVEKAKNAGADLAGSDEFIEKIQKGWFDFDVIITKPMMMKKLGKLGRILGSKGLMPNPKTGTVTQDIEKSIKEFKSGKFEYRNDKDGILHVVIGNSSFTEENIVENFISMYEFLLKIKPNKSKGAYFKSISLCSTQSPSILVEPMKVKWSQN